MSPADLIRWMGSERPRSPHPGPTHALRWSGAQPSETVGLRPPARRPRRGTLQRALS